MLDNNLKIGFRTLRKNKVYTTINILGLAIGIAAVLLIYHMVKYELSFNKGFTNYDRIVRVVHSSNDASGEMEYNVCMPIPAMAQVEEKISHIEKVARIHELFGTLTVPSADSNVPKLKFSQGRDELAFFADPSFFEIFDFVWLAGESSTALDEPASIVLTQSWAEKCFGTWGAAMGKILMIDNLVEVIVKGVIVDVPSNVDFPLPFIVSYKTVENNPQLFFYAGSQENQWGNCSSNDQVFALLHEDASLSDANALAAEIGKDEYKKMSRSNKDTRVHHLQPLSDLHFDDRYGNSASRTVSKSRIKVLGIIGLLILLIGCFNFINLATAQSLLRAKEVGVRKTLGSSRLQLIYQFLGETGLIVSTAVILGAYLAHIGTPLLQHVSYVPATAGIFSDPLVFGYLALTGIGITILSGIYPALALSSFKPTQALNSQSERGTWGANTIRKGLVVLQFTAALALIISAIITLQQLDFIKAKDLGFKKDFVYTFTYNNDEQTISKQSALRQKMIQIPSVESVSFSNDQPISGNTWNTNFRYRTRAEDEKFNISLRFCDPQYFETYGITFVAGQGFTTQDSMKHCVINMTVLQKLGITDPQEAIGQIINLGGGKLNIPITGVVKDFHTHSFRMENEPLLLTSRKMFYVEAGLRIRPENVATTIAAIRAGYDEVLPEQIFNGSFLDDNIKRFYEADTRLTATCWAFGFLAIFISCLGLFGLATHAVRQRVKEIGIRKVLGANVINIIALLSKDFMILVIIALLVASPLAWYAMDQWLQNFAYSIDIESWVFILAGLVTVTIAFVTVGFQSTRAAIVNPVESLRNE
ncbi:MAG: ABC transporter permease [Saprospiraceae bacterium]